MANYTSVRSACETFGVPIPDAVTKAAEVAAVFDAALDKETQHTKPSPAGILADVVTALDKGAKVPNVDKAVDEIVDFDARHAARVEILKRLASDANAQVETAWWRSVPSIAVALGPIFDSEVARFLAASAECDGLTAEAAIDSNRGDAWRAMTDAAAKLSQLRGVRRDLALAERTEGLAPGSPEDWCCIARLDDGEVWGRRIPVRLSGIPVGSREWWRTLAAIPGVHLAWAATRDEADERAREMARRTKREPGESVTKAKPVVGPRVPGPGATASISFAR